MSTSHDDKIAEMPFAKVYPLYVAKVERKGRTQAELNEIITWLTGYTQEMIQKHIDSKITFDEFFKQAQLHPNAHLIKGMICGYRVEEIENALTRQVRYMDKLVDELAKGKQMDKILRA